MERSGFARALDKLVANLRMTTKHRIGRKT
jgi:hypothetical protein